MPLACYRVTARVVAETPLHIGSGRRTGVIKRTLPFIPGSFLRGAIGVSIIKSVCKKDEPLKVHEDCEFFEECEYANLYGEEFGKASRIFFRYAYPVHLACGGVYLPAPKTMFRCENPQCGKLYDSVAPPVRCEVDGCGMPLKPVRGFVCAGCGNVAEAPVPVSRVVLTALDRRYRSAAQIPTPEGGGKTGTLHALDVIGAGSSFFLEVIVDRRAVQYLSLVENALRRGLPDEGIGGSKSRGLGKVRVEDLVVREVTVKDLEKRAEEIDTRCFSVRLVSPMVLGGGKPLDRSALLEAARRAYSWCFREGKPKLPEVELVGKMFSYEPYSGWSLKDGRRRRVEASVSPGSVFQFSCEENDETLALALSALELYAVGSYKPHGCGQVVIEGAR